MAEINLLKNYPKVSRNLDKRFQEKTSEIQKVARQFGKDFFDGDRKYGYGGYQYHKRFWQPVIPTFQEHYALRSGLHILDVGCAKGFMLHDFVNIIPGIHVEGIDISAYAVQHAIEDMKPHIKIGDAKQLDYEDKSFDLVISINTVHNLSLKECKQAICEIQRVSKKHAFITVDAYRTEDERKKMEMWNLTAKTYMHVEEWISLFEEVGYEGDYDWFIP